MQDEVTCDKVGVCSLTGVPQEVPAIRLEEEMASPAAAVVRLRGSAAPFISLLLVKGAFVPGVSDATGKVYHSMLLSAINTFLPSFLPSFLLRQPHKECRRNGRSGTNRRLAVARIRSNLVLKGRRLLCAQKLHVTVTLARFNLMRSRSQFPTAFHFTKHLQVQRNYLQ